MSFGRQARSGGPGSFRFVEDWSTRIFVVTVVLEGVPQDHERRDDSYQTTHKNSYGPSFKHGQRSCRTG